MNVLVGYALYLIGIFGTIALALFHVLPVDYLGGIIIALFIAGLVYTWLNAWRQTDKLIEVDRGEQSELEEHETEIEQEYPYPFEHRAEQPEKRKKEEEEVSVAA